VQGSSLVPITSSRVSGLVATLMNYYFFRLHPCREERLFEDGTFPYSCCANHTVIQSILGFAHTRQENTHIMTIPWLGSGRLIKIPMDKDRRGGIAAYRETRSPRWPLIGTSTIHAWDRNLRRPSRVKQTPTRSVRSFKEVLEWVPGIASPWREHRTLAC
jgi:hypothetical protein